MERVLDATRLIPGGVATRILKDLGYEIIKIEDTDKGDYMRTLSPKANEYLNAGKKSISLNLKSNEGLKIFYDLIKISNVFIESFRPGVAERLKIGYEELHKINPELVYCSIYGYGDKNNLPGHDINFTAHSGIDTVLPVQIADTGSALYADLMIVNHLHNKDSSHIIINMSEVPEIFNIYSMFTEKNVLNGNYPCYSIYKTKDGVIALGCLEDKFWINFVKAIGKPELEKSNFNSNIMELLRIEIAKYSTYEILEMGKRFNFPVSIVRPASKLMRPYFCIIPREHTVIKERRNGYY